MKKLMFLGGGRFIVPAIRAAIEQGYYTITCDYLPNNYAHKYSHEYHNISIVDKDAVLKLAESFKIDGIMSFAVDPGVTVAAYVAEKMGLPNVGPYESVSILQNKGLFRAFLRDHGFNTPLFGSYNSLKNALADIDRFVFPVIVKPVDGSGSKGVKKASNVDEAIEAIKIAREKSFCNEIIIEEFIEKKGCSSDSDSFSINGKMVVTSFNSQFFDSKASNKYVPAGFMWPSSMSDESQIFLSSELQRLISLLGMRTALYNIETREDIKGTPYIMECTPRAGGNRLSEMMRFVTGIDMITASVRAAVGDQVSEIHPKTCVGYWGEIILHSRKNGIFKELWISDEIKPYVVEKDLWISKHEKVEMFNSASQAIGTIIINVDEKDKLVQIMNDIDKYIRVII